MRPRHYIKEYATDGDRAYCGARVTKPPKDTAPRCERCRIEVEKLKAPTSVKAKAERMLSGGGK